MRQHSTIRDYPKDITGKPVISTHLLPDNFGTNVPIYSGQIDPNRVGTKFSLKLFRDICPFGDLHLLMDKLTLNGKFLLPV